MLTWSAGTGFIRLLTYDEAAVKLLWLRSRKRPALSAKQSTTDNDNEDDDDCVLSRLCKRPTESQPTSDDDVDEHLLTVFERN